MELQRGEQLRSDAARIPRGAQCAPGMSWGVRARESELGAVSGGPEVAEPSLPPPRQIPALPLARPAVPKKEKTLEDEKSPAALTKAPRAELCGAPEAVTSPGGAHGEAGNGSCRAVQKPPRKLQPHHSIHSQSSKKSKGSSKSPSSHIPIEAQEDCCVHCILSCLFCEFLTLCNIVLDCATCGSCTSEDSCICCCCCNSGECADCDLPCDMDCGIIDACCESADCLEICMECCGLCFSS
ncbi:PREDICTED: myoD family inhibitor [Ficedula albicollis]|uniref:myoD family inhibitor n=1 Tax=Ficedula albicollis TaxID=59894 RepID=UPI00035A086D|nr:PREDICTED: myoD family inhibitor [Ficedula albicollis]